MPSLSNNVSPSTSLLPNLSDSPTNPPREAVLAFLPDLSLLGVALIWGINIPFMKMGLGLLENVYVFNALRLPISVAVVGFFALRERRRGVLPAPGVRLRHIAVYATLVSVLYQLFFLVGMDHTTPGNAALILATVPMWTALLACAFIGERLRFISWVGLSLALFGTIVVAMQGGSVSGDRGLLFGNLTMLGSALLWAMGTVYSKPLLEKISPLQLAASASLMGLPAHFVFAYIAANAESVTGLGSMKLWLVVLFSGTLSSGLAQPMWHYGVRHAGAAHAAVMQNLVPVVAMVAAWVMFKMQPTAPQMVGGGLILGGLCLMRIGRASRTSRSK